LSAIPDRNPLSEFFGKHADTPTPKLIDLWVETLKSAIGMLDRGAARSRLDHALECYHELKTRGLDPDLGTDIDTAMMNALKEFPTADHVFPALDLLDRAGKTHNAAEEMRMLGEAEALLNAGLEKPDTNHEALQEVLQKVRAALVPEGIKPN
jgi:hypothetical protein